MNAINVIAPYKHLGMWVFDDPRVGLDKEPFVSATDAMIDRLVADIPDAANGFVTEGGGNWYYSPQLDMEGWLCPALLKYFPEAPRALYVQVKPRPAER